MMENVTDNVTCEHFEAGVFAKSHCQSCSEVHKTPYDSSVHQGYCCLCRGWESRPRCGGLKHRAPRGDKGADSRPARSPRPIFSTKETERPVGAEAPYCDLHPGPHHPKDTLCILTSSCELVVATGPEQKPESLGVPVEWHSAENCVAQPGGREIGGGVPYLESLTSPQLRNSSEDSQASRATASISPDLSAGTHCPDDTSTPDAADLDAVDWPEKPWGADGLIMMFARHQERALTNSPHRAPSSVSRVSATDPSHGNQNSRESWSKSHGEKGYFSLERNKLDSAQASKNLQSGLRSTSRNPGPAKTTYHDTPQASSPQQSTQRGTTRSSSPHRSTQRDATRSSSPHRSTQREATRSSSPHRSTQRDATRSSSPQRSTQRDATRASSPQRSTQRDATRSSSPHRCTQRDTTRSSSPHRSTQRDAIRASSPQRSTQRDATRASSPQRSTQRDATRSSSPHRSTQRDATRSSSPQRSTQRDATRASSPQRSTQRDATRSSSPHRCTQRDATRASSPHRSTQRDATRSSSPHRSTQRDATRSSSPHRSTQRDATRSSSPQRPTQRDTTRSSSPHRSTQRDATRASCPHRSTQRDATRSSSPHRSTQRDATRSSSPQRSTQRDATRASSPHRSTQRDATRASSPHRPTQRDATRSSSPHRSTQRDITRASSPHQSSTQRDTIQRSSTQRDNPRTSSTQRDNPRASSPAWSTPKDNPRASSSQRDSPRASSMQRDNPGSSSSARSIQWDNLQACPSQQDNPRTCSAQRDNPRASSPARTIPKDNPRASSTQWDNPRSSSIQRDNPGSSSPTRSSQRSNPRTSSPHRTNRDIPWASFPLRPIQSDGTRASSPAHSKQSEVPWASFPLRPVQVDNSRTSSPTRSSPLSSKTSQRDTPTRGSSCHSGPRSSTPPLSSTRTASQASSLSRSTSLDSPNPPSVVCIGHRDAPRASSPPRFSQHDPFSFFPEPHDDESQSPHHEPPYIPPAVCIGHRDAPRASSPPRHSQHDPFPFLPNTSDTAESQSPQHDPPQMPPPVCIGHRDAPRASSPPRQSQQEPSLLYQDPPGASCESLAPSTSSVHDPPNMPPPVCIGHRDAPPFSSPPRYVQHDPSLLYQDAPGASSESLVLSMDSQHDPPQMPPPVCIGHRDAPLFTSPPRQAHNDPSLLTQNPPGASSESLTPSMDFLHDPLQPTIHVCIGHRDAPRASSPPRHWDPPGVARYSSPPPGPSASKGSGNGEGRRNLEREEYTVLADLPPPKRLNQKEAMGKQNGSASDRTRSPGRTEVERIFGCERRRSEALETYQALEAGRSQRGSGRASGQLQRRQSSPALGREVTKKPPQPSEQAHRGRAEPPHTKSPERRHEGDRGSKGGSAPPKNLVKLPERECRARGQLVHSKSLDMPPENDRLGQRQPLGLRHLGKSMDEEWGPPEESSISRSSKRHLERDWGGPGQAYSGGRMERDFSGREGHSCTRALDMYPDSEWRGPTKEIVGCWRALAEQVCCTRLERLRQSGQLLDWDGLPPPGRSEWDCNGLGELSPPPVPERPAKVSWGSLGELPRSWRLERADEMDWGGLGESAFPRTPERPLDVDWRDLGQLPQPAGTDWRSLGELLRPRSPHSCREIEWGARGEPVFTEGCWLENGEARPPTGTEETPEREWQSASEPAGLVIHDRQAETNGHSLGERLLSPIPSVEENGADLGQPISSAPWPKTKLESGHRALEAAGLQEGEDEMANNLPLGPHPSEEPEPDGRALPEPGHPGAATGQEKSLMTDQEKSATVVGALAAGGVQKRGLGWS